MNGVVLLVKEPNTYASTDHCIYVHLQILIASRRHRNDEVAKLSDSTHRGGSGFRKRMGFTRGLQVGLPEFGHEPRPTLRASLFFLLFLNSPLTSAIVAVFKIVVRFWWRHTHVLPGKGLLKGKVENERSHGGSHRIFTLYCGKSRGTERKGKERKGEGKLMGHSESSYLAMGS